MDQTQAPVLDALAAALRRSTADFGAPGHGRGRAAPAAVRRLLGRAAFAADLLTPKGLDDRSETGQVVQTAHALAAEAWGADLARFATGGSTQNLHVLLAAVAKPGETVLVASNAHKAEWSAALYAGIDVVPVPVEIDPVWDLEHGVAPARLAAAFDAHPHAVAAVVVSPSYFGVTGDVPGLAAVCHARGRPLVVDAAWGAAFPFSPRLPAHPLEEGADAAVVSAHKTLAALGQGSVMLLKGGRIDAERAKLAFELFQTTSPSVAVLASLDGARREMALHGERLWDRVIDLAERTRAKLARIEGVRLLGADDLSGPGTAALSPCVLTLDISGLGVSGWLADDWLSRTHGVTAGLSDARRLLFNFTQGANARDAGRLVAAVRELASLARGKANPFPPAPDAPRHDELTIDLAMAPVEAFAGETELTPFGEAEGRVAAEVLAPAPPGVPRLIPGQRITAAHVRLLQAMVEGGGFLLDPADDPEPRRVRVVR